MTTFVLVHGAWGGSYGWTAFANLLRADGHNVFTPSLTGLGERTHLGGPGVNLTTHVTDVENVFKYENLSDAVLVGHSYGGMVVTGVADRLPQLISHLVYSDAFLPRDGQSCFDLGGAGGLERARIEDGWKVASMAAPIENPTAEQARQAALRSPQPLGTLTEGVRLSVPLEARAFTRTYLKAAGGAADDLSRTGHFWDAYRRVKDDPRWRTYEFACGHGMHRELPNEIRAAYYEIAGLRSGASVG
jgi:pimeloyl-ACP methyl ester carboxylesterase